MSVVSITVVSKKGQVVIPQNIREEIKIGMGTKLAVYGRGDTIFLKKVQMPSAEDFESLLSKGKKFALKKKIKVSQVLKDD